MSIESDHYNDSVKMIREHWFPDHIAIFQKFIDHAPHENMASTIECLRWTKPNTSTYLVLYFIYRNTLTVMGDIGTATYRWSQSVTFDWIAKCDFSYFASKLEGINGSGDHREWDSDILRLRVKEAGSREFRQEAESRLSDRDEWHRFLWDKVNSNALSYDVAGDMAEWGLVPNTRIIGHWMGLRMALQVK